MTKILKTSTPAIILNNSGDKIFTTRDISTNPITSGLIYDMTAESIENVSSHCRTMYNQTGGTNWVQTTVGNQPLVVNNYLNGKVALQGGSFETTMVFGLYTIFMVIGTSTSGNCYLTINGLTNYIGYPKGFVYGSENQVYYRNNKIIAAGTVLPNSTNLIVCVNLPYAVSNNWTFSNLANTHKMMAVKIYNRTLTPFERSQVNYGLGSIYNISMEV